MICKACAQGADALTRGPINPNLVAAAKGLHDVCDGCDCQHKVDTQAEGKSVRK